MVRALCTVLILSLACEIASADATPPKNRNAALKYWQAVATLPNEEIQKTFDFQALIDEKSRELVKKHDYSLRMLRHATQTEHCDWENDYEEGIEHMLPQVQACRSLARLALLRARIQFEDGDHDAAIDDCFDAVILGRRLTPEGSFVSLLVGYSIEFQAQEVLAANLPKLSKDEIQQVAKRYEAAPPVASLSSVMNHAEIRCLDWIIDRTKKQKSNEELVAFFKSLVGPETDANEFVQQCGGNVEGVIRTTEAAQPHYAKFAAILDLPLEESKAKFEEEFQKAKQNPVLFVFLPAIIKVRDAKARADVRKELFRAAIAVQLNGADALKNHSDPVAGGTFKIEKFDGGFELQSNHVQENVGPLKMVVGVKK